MDTIVEIGILAETGTVCLAVDLWAAQRWALSEHVVKAEHLRGSELACAVYLTEMMLKFSYIYTYTAGGQAGSLSIGKSQNTDDGSN